MNPKLNIIVGQNIKRLRIKRKLTQEQLSENTGIDYKYIQKVEGKNPPNITLKTLEKLAKVLKTTPANLLK